MGMRTVLWAALALGALALVGCGRESADWKSAATADTSEAYRQFLQQHPNAAAAPQARARIQQLEEDRDWQAAAAADTREAYEQFVAQHPDSKWSQEARIRIENFAQTAVAGAAAGAAVSPAVAAPSAPKATAPSPKAARVSAPVKAPAGRKVASSAPGSFVQLGAFRTKQRAQIEWQRLSARFPAEFRSLKPRYVAGTLHAERVYRLQVPVATASGARKLCATLKKHSLACMAVTT